MMEQEKAEELLAADTFALVDRYTQMVNITLIGGMNIAYGYTINLHRQLLPVSLQFQIARGAEHSGAILFKKFERENGFLPDHILLRQLSRQFQGNNLLI